MTAPIQVAIAGTGGDAGMSVLEFIATMTQALAWPISAIVVALILKKPLTRLLGKLRSLGFGDAKAEFGEQLDDAEVKAATLDPTQIPEPIDAPVEPVPPQVDRRVNPFSTFEMVAVVSPEAAILDIWSYIYKLLKQLADQQGVKARNALSTIDQLALKGLLTGLEVSLLNDLRVMRNLAAHSGDVETPVTLSDAVRYREIAQTIEPTLVRAINAHTRPPSFRSD